MQVIQRSRGELLMIWDYRILDLAVVPLPLPLRATVLPQHHDAR